MGLVCRCEMFFVQQQQITEPKIIAMGHKSPFEGAICEHLLSILLRMPVERSPHQSVACVQLFNLYGARCGPAKRNELVHCPPPLRSTRYRVSPAREQHAFIGSSLAAQTILGPFLRRTAGSQRRPLLSLMLPPDNYSRFFRRQ